MSERKKAEGRLIEILRCRKRKRGRERESEWIIVRE